MTDERELRTLRTVISLRNRVLHLREAIKTAKRELAQEDLADQILEEALSRDELEQRDEND